jgi:Ca2+-binding RTX toxin-like protein
MRYQCYHMGFKAIILTLLFATFLSQAVVLTFQIASGIVTIGNQANVETPKGKIVRCAGNLLITPAMCVGTDKNDTIVDPLHGGTIYGFKGNDKFQGLLGHETVFGGGGNDAIQAGNDSATLFGNDGNDILVGSLAGNILFGGGSVFMYGGNGDDHLIGGVDYDIMTGGPGHDTFDCKGREDLIMDYDLQNDNKSGNCVLF